MELNELNSLPLLFSLGPLVGKVKEYHVETIVDTLCSNMLSDNEQLRDISSIGEFGWRTEWNQFISYSMVLGAFLY